VVEKELLHHDILRTLSETGMLAQLTFMGGTCLRACYGSNRLSEDLDFTGGAEFSRESLSAMARVLISTLKTKYSLPVEVSDPTREVGNVDTWKIKVQTHPGRNDRPAQRINIDVCAIPSHQTHPTVLLNPYGVDMGTSGLILQVESREEIYVDKLIAFALRPNRIKNRDLWDMAWLHQQSIKPQTNLLAQKLKDHKTEPLPFLKMFDDRRQKLQSDPKLAVEFRQEMRRFLSSELVAQTVDQAAFWEFLTNLMNDLYEQIRKVLSDKITAPTFYM
jgi:predicted nucleotidyltransferase component of viral defense system